MKILVIYYEDFSSFLIDFENQEFFIFFHKIKNFIF